MIARLYLRTFKHPEMVQRMLGTIDTHVMHRIAAVTASLLVYVPSERPDQMIELWEYPDEESMLWVRQSMQGATVIPDAMLPENEIHNLDLVLSHNADWD